MLNGNSLVNSRLNILDLKGGLHIPLLLVIFLITLSGFRIWGLLRNWRFLMETQLRLDRCVGEVAQDFRNILQSLESRNRKIQGLRVAIQAAELEPTLLPPLQGALVAQVALQDWDLGRWKLRSARWWLEKGCGGGWRDIVYPLPELRFTRDPPDWIGSQALRWEGAMPREFTIRASRRPRRTLATVRGGSNEVWTAVWGASNQLSGAGFR